MSAIALCDPTILFVIWTCSMSTIITKEVISWLHTHNFVYQLL